MFLLHCLAEPCCGAVLLLNPLLRILKSKRLRPFKLLTSFSARCFSRSPKRHTSAADCCREITLNFFLFASGVDLVVGRLGFEPRQRDSKSLDLPLVDRPVHAPVTTRSYYRPACSLCEHPFPILGSRQGLRQERLDARGLDALLSRLCLRFRPVKSKQSRAGT
jgi:hypothetical protein